MKDAAADAATSFIGDVLVEEEIEADAANCESLEPEESDRIARTRSNVAAVVAPLLDTSSGPIWLLVNLSLFSDARGASSSSLLSLDTSTFGKHRA